MTILGNHCWTKEKEVAEKQSIDIDFSSKSWLMILTNHVLSLKEKLLNGMLPATVEFKRKNTIKRLDKKEGIHISVSGKKLNMKTYGYLRSNR